MPKREKTRLTESEFEAAKIKLFASAKDELKVFGKKLADYCWNLDHYAVWQFWEGHKKRLLVFGVPPEQRARANAKNYFSIWKVKSSQDDALKCEVVFPKSDTLRQKLLSDHDPQQMLRISSIRAPEGYFRPSDYEYLIDLINSARDQRIAAP